jgi:GDPmannose 4,6-dehydratase
VHGVARRCSSKNLRLLDVFAQNRNLQTKLILHFGDVTDPLNIRELIAQINPDEIYNLAAQSNVKLSFDTAFHTAQTNALGTLNILEAIRSINTGIRFYQASSGEMFGKAEGAAQNENTPFNPQSPYAIAKLYSYWITINYRKAYGIFACNGILFNHESHLRDETFVTKKITRSVARIHYGLQETLYLGNLNARRDWGFAKDYVETMWLMLQQEKPDDYVVATGKNHSVREFVEYAFNEIHVEIDWQGEGIDEKGIDKKTGKVIVAVDPAYFRPTEVEYSVGDPSKAIRELQWEPHTDFSSLVSAMVQHDLAEIKEEVEASSGI